LNTKGAVILFDGHCLLCNYWVKRIIRYDRQGYFRLGTLQSEAARALLSGFTTQKIPDSVVLIEDNQMFTESEAALQIVKKLACLSPLYWLFIFWPAGIRNRLYQWVARNRYHWFGRTESCRVPDETIEKRFIS